MSDEKTPAPVTTLKEATLMIKNYRAYAERNPDFKLKPHVKSVWFSIDQITSMYEQLKKEGANGVKVYFGRYPSDVSIFDDPKPIPNSNTVVFVSTKADPTNPQARTDSYEVIENRGMQCEPDCIGDSIDDKP